MAIEIVTLEPEHLMKLIENAPPIEHFVRGLRPEPVSTVFATDKLASAYFSPGSVAHCLLNDGVPVFAGGIVNLQWHRGEAWIWTTQFFRDHVKTCFGIIRKMLPRMATENGFIRVQAVASEGICTSLFEHLEFVYEGTLKHFGPFGETCRLYARFFEEVGKHAATD